MIFLRKLLFPFAILYGMVTGIRNFLYDTGILKSVSFNVPVIAVGNLSVGGTGKTPQIEYLVRLLSSDFKLATLSRGYKRKSEGFVLADANASAEILGDEPFQFHRKFPELTVAVDADRVNGITKLLARDDRPEVILLDDAFQHRKVKAGFYILLTSYGDLFSDDFILPMGNLRESRSGSKRADIIVVTKCPPELARSERDKISRKLDGNGQKIYFSAIGYDDHVYSGNEKIEIAAIAAEGKLIVAGIAKPKPFFEHLQKTGDDTLEFPDHHNFSDAEISRIIKKANGRKILTTEKDHMRLQNLLPGRQLYYLPIRSYFLDDSDSFDSTVLAYVESVRR
jgi:tetraacyldisaccharide 4'-kinase